MSATASDHATFDCVYRGQWFTLASGARHRRDNVGVPGSKLPDHYLIYDRMHRVQTVPKAEVHIRWS